MRRALVLLTLLFARALHAAAIDARALETLIDGVMAVEMKKQQIPGAAFILVQNGHVVLAKGYGFADVEHNKPVDPAKTIFPIGSITKVFTATAVVQLAERGKLDLNADVNRYLKTIKVPATYPAPVTARHLLTHTAGFDELRGRLLESADDRVQPLDEFLGPRLVRIRPPGEMTAYSSFGVSLAGLLVEDVSGLSYERYLTCNVWAPLRMNRTHITTPETQRDDRAIAYEADAGGKLAPIPWERYHSTPASSINSTATDMGRYMLALLGEGVLDGQRILSAKSVRAMTTQQITMHPHLPGFGYLFQLANTNGQRIVEHGGNIGGFHSLMTLLPDQETGFFVIAHREGADLRSPVRKAILDRWFPDPHPPAPPKADPAAAPHLARLAGVYRANIWCHTCPFDPDRVQDVSVSVNTDGSIKVWDESWIEVSPLFFRSADGKRRIGFHEDAKGNVTALTSGSWMVMERLPDRTP